MTAGYEATASLKLPSRFAEPHKCLAQMWVIHFSDEGNKGGYVMRLFPSTIQLPNADMKTSY